MLDKSLTGLQLLLAMPFFRKALLVVQAS